MHWSVICIPGSRRAGDSGHTAGLKCRDFLKTFDECRGCAGVLISR